MLPRSGWMFAAFGLLAAGCAAIGPVPAEGVATTADPTTSEAPAMAAVAAPPDPAQVVGMIQTDVRRLLGEPSLVRTESSGEVWQYRRSGCVMDLYLYRNGQPDVREVTYFELRDQQKGQKLTDLAARTCFGRILRA